MGRVYSNKQQQTYGRDKDNDSSGSATASLEVVQRIKGNNGKVMIVILVPPV